MYQKVTAIQAAMSGLYDAIVNKMMETRDFLHTYISQHPVVTELQTALSDVTDWVSFLVYLSHSYTFGLSYRGSWSFQCQDNLKGFSHVLVAVSQLRQSLMFL